MEGDTSCTSLTEAAVAPEAPCDDDVGQQSFDSNEEEDDFVWLHTEEWEAPISWLTLRFSNQLDNRQFYEQLVVNNLAVQDRILCFVCPGIAITLAFKVQQWTLLHYVAIMAALFQVPLVYSLSRMRTPQAKHRYLRYRSGLMLAWRVVGILVAQLGHSAIIQTEKPSSFLVHLILDSCSFAILTLTLGPVLPFWLHVLSLPFMLGMLWVSSTVSELSHHLCSHFPGEVWGVYQFLSWASTIVKPVETQYLLNKLTFLPIVGHEWDTCGIECPATKLVLFMQVGLGAVLSTVLLYRMEWAARLRFFSTRSDPNVTEGTWRYSQLLLEMHSYWTSWLLGLGQLYMAFAILWQILLVLA